MGPGSDGAPGVVQEKREIKNKRILELLEKCPVGTQLRIFCLYDLVEFVDADQGVFIRGVTMKKFMLHQAGELAEFRHVTAEKIDSMHHTQHQSELTFARNNR